MNLQQMLDAAQQNDAMHAAAQAAHTHPDWMVAAVIVGLAVAGALAAMRGMSR